VKSTRIASAGAETRVVILDSGEEAFRGADEIRK
jgi:hypothetical protein